jgi:hypothetical protein
MEQPFNQRRYLAWTAKITVSNITKTSVDFGDDILIMAGNGKKDFDGAYIAYSNESSANASNSDYFNRSQAYALGNYERSWSDGTMRGYRNGGTYSFADPPDYKPEVTICNTTLNAGKTASVVKVFTQGSYFNLHTRVLLVIPEMKSGKNSSRLVVEFTPSAKTKGDWVQKSVRTINLAKADLLKLIGESKGDSAMTILALNWLAKVDEATVKPILTSIVKEKNDERLLVTSIEIFSNMGIEPDTETLATIKSIAALNSTFDWAAYSAKRYLKAKGIAVDDRSKPVESSKNDVTHPKITKTYDDGTQYVGEWKDDLKNGQGTYTWGNGDRYIGEWKDNKKDGQGTYTWASGDKYVGEWKDDKMSGQGTCTWANGNKYSGEWKDDKRNGQGTFTWSDGDKYVGEWKDDKKYNGFMYNKAGNKIASYSNGLEQLIGEWKDNKKDGKGTYLWANGDKYVGECTDGIKSGQGTKTWATGEEYIGEWKNDKMSGQGTCTWANGNKYVGEWKDNKKDGQGTFTWSDGEKYVGEWKYDKMSGQGTYKWANGDKYVGEWKDDKKYNGITSDKAGNIIARYANGVKE